MNKTDSSPSRRGRSAIPGLIVLNALLLGALALVSFGSEADAQGRQRSRGSYTMVGGEVLGSLAAAVYIADTANQELMVITYDPQQKALKGLAYRNLAADAAEATTARGTNR